MSAATGIDIPAMDRSTTGRWIYFGSACLFTAAALVGFAPRSIEILTATHRNPPCTAVVLGHRYTIVVEHTVVDGNRDTADGVLNLRARSDGFVLRVREIQGT